MLHRCTASLLAFCIVPGLPADFYALRCASSPPHDSILIVCICVALVLLCMRACVLPTPAARLDVQRLSDDECLCACRGAVRVGGCVMCNKGKKRVRNANRYPSNAERRAHAVQLKANLQPREGSRRASKHGVTDPLHGIVSAFACDAAAAHALEELQRVVDIQPAHKWKLDDLNCLANCKVKRQQLHCQSMMTRPNLAAAATRAADALCASAPPVPGVARQCLLIVGMSVMSIGIA